MKYTVLTEMVGGELSTVAIDDYKAAIEFAEANSSVLGMYTVVINNQNNHEVYKSTDDPALKAYNNKDYEGWSTVQHGHHEKSNGSSVYIDIDGVLAKWHEDMKGLTYEQMLDPKNHYFRDLEAVQSLVMLAKGLQDRGFDVNIISAADKNTIRDKWNWLEENMPFIPKENICFCPIGADKNEFVKGNSRQSILIDDYNRNLDDWKGLAVKAINGVNSHQNKYPEIDLTAAEKLIAEHGLDDPNTKAAVNKAVQTTADQIGQMIDRLNSEHLYAVYKDEWINENISDKVMGETRELLEKHNVKAYIYPDEMYRLTLDEYVEDYGFADGSTFKSYDEFNDELLPCYATAEALEQFMFERGEYDFSDKIHWLGETRDATVKNIRAELLDGDSHWKIPMINYLKDQMAEIDDADNQYAAEDFAWAKEIVNSIERISGLEASDIERENGAKVLIQNSPNKFDDKTFVLAENIGQFMADSARYGLALDDPDKDLLWTSEKKSETVLNVYKTLQTNPEALTAYLDKEVENITDSDRLAIAVQRLQNEISALPANDTPAQDAHELALKIEEYLFEVGVYARDDLTFLPDYINTNSREETVAMVEEALENKRADEMREYIEATREETREEADSGVMSAFKAAVVTGAVLHYGEALAKMLADYEKGKLGIKEDVSKAAKNKTDVER